MKEVDEPTPGISVKDAAVKQGADLASLLLQERAAFALLARVNHSQLRIITYTGFNSHKNYAKSDNNVKVVKEVEFVDKNPTHGVAAVDSGDEIAALGQCVHLVVEDGVEAFLPLSGLVDTKKERLRLSRQSAKLAKDIQVLEDRLSGPGFVQRAPTKLVEETRKKLQDIRQQRASVVTSLDALPGEEAAS